MILLKNTFLFLKRNWGLFEKGPANHSTWTFSAYRTEAACCQKLLYMNLLWFVFWWQIIVMKRDKSYFMYIWQVKLICLFVFCLLLFVYWYVYICICVYISGRSGQFASDTSCYPISPRGSHSRAVLPYIGGKVLINSIFFFAFLMLWFWLIF